ncbi:FG-GAP repeat-domain-containing protein, partial [Tribonema minus]
PVAGDFFGYAVAVSGSYAVVGAIDKDPLAIPSTGAAYILELNGSTGEWEHKAVLYPTDVRTTDQFGYSVAVSGTYAVVGAYASDPGGKTDAGAAYVFERNSGTGAWTQGTKLVASDAMTNDYFGYTVSVSGTYAIVGAYNKKQQGDALSSGAAAGAAYVFERNSGTGAWASGTKLVASDAMPGDRFGSSVSVSGTYAVVGAYWRTQLGVGNSGGVYVFERNSGTAVWEQKAVLFPSDLATGSFFGTVSVSGTYAMVGAYGKTGGGGAYVYERNSGTGAWEEKAILPCSDSTIASFGQSVAIDGTYAVVGAYTKTVSSLASAGGAYMFERLSGTWTQTAILDNPDPAASDFFGISVAVNGIYAVIGCNGKYPASKSMAGATYLYKRNSTTGAWENKTASQSVLITGLTALTTYYFWVRAKVTSSSAYIVLSASSGAITTVTPPSGTATLTFGCAVAVSGSYAVVGAQLKDPLSVANAGGAYVLELSGTTEEWEHKAVLYPADAYAGDTFGSSVAVSGTYAVIGASTCDPGGETGAGAAYVFERNSSTGAWTQGTKLVASDAAPFDTFGYSVSVSGTYAIVGAYNRKRLGAANSGGAYVFERNSGSGWEHKAVLYPTDACVNDGFGCSVAVSGTYAVVGASIADPGGKADAGAAYVFERNSGTGAWEQKTKLVASDAMPNDYFGYSVSVSGTYAVVGAYVRTQLGVVYSGGAYVFERNSGTGTWEQMAGLYPSDLVTFSRFGWSVSVSGTCAIVGALSKSGVGGAYIYERNSVGAWEEKAILTASDSTAQFGISVSIDGTYAVVGANNKTVSSLNGAGGAYVFERAAPSPPPPSPPPPARGQPPTGEWEHKAVLYPTDAYASDFFGYSVAVSGTYAVVGAFFSDPGGKTSAGAAYVFERNSGTIAWEQKTKLVASDAMPNDYFGYSVSVSGTYAVVGAYNRKQLGVSSSGGAYVFERNSGTTVWEQKAVLFPSDLPTGSFFGNSVSVSVTYAIVGAYGKSGGGGAYVYERNSGTGTWEEKAILTMSDTTTGQFGYSVFIDGTYAIVGARLKTVSKTNSGAAYVFERNSGTTAWEQKTKLVAADAMPSDQFGYSVSVSGTYAVVGAYVRKRLGVANSGGAYVFERNSTSGVWEQKTVLFPSDLPTGSMFGYSVSVSGTCAIVGAYSKSGGGGAYIFERNSGTSAWEEKTILACPDSISAIFGFSVSIDGTYAVVSGRNKTVSSVSNAGAAYAYERLSGTPPPSPSPRTPSFRTPAASSP